MNPFDVEMSIMNHNHKDVGQLTTKLTDDISLLKIINDGVQEI